MEKSTNYNFNLPNSANDEIADINDISDNFRIIDEKLKIDQTFLGSSENPQSGKAIAGEIGKKQDYFADISDDSQNRNINLTDKNRTVVGQIVVVPTEGIRYTNVLTPENETDGANKKYVDDTTINVKSYVNNNFANALKGSASGEAVRLSDIAPNEHTLGVKVSGKNLLPNPNVHAYNYSLDYKKYNNTDEIFLTAGTYSLSASANCPTLQFWNKETKQPYTVDEAVSAYSTNTYYKIYDGRALGRASDSVRNMWFTLKIDALITLNSGYSEVTSQKCQIEIGSTATPYTPYISLTTVNVTRYGTVETDSPQTYTPTADGTVSGVKSLYPITTLMTDTAGVIINAEYNKDLNKAFAELQQAILSIGGNV